MPQPCSRLCRFFYVLLDDNGDGLATLPELIRYFDALDDRRIGRKNVENVSSSAIRFLFSNSLANSIAVYRLPRW